MLNFFLSRRDRRLSKPKLLLLWFLEAISTLRLFSKSFLSWVGSPTTIYFFSNQFITSDRIFSPVAKLILLSFWVRN